MSQDDPVRIIPHAPEGIPDTGSFEVVWPGGNRHFYWDENAGRRAITLHDSRDEALEKARALARAERDRLEHACPGCDGTGWVCEDHQDQPWDGPHACSCGAAGAPCPRCNWPEDGELPRMPDGFQPG
ncbi:hypothetical protein [Azospirillum sp.]|uniref:hypothetical protein n=1 Tax=Azospirillum sp. TaxID=34012 RepID=UPI002D67C49E|nr:hypothetical protein [Azospirillum sp.]HYD66144.1 hypothetical protein [Azospirillum sp.]